MVGKTRELKTAKHTKGGATLEQGKEEKRMMNTKVGKGVRIGVESWNMMIGGVGEMGRGKRNQIWNPMFRRKFKNNGRSKVRIPMEKVIL